MKKKELKRQLREQFRDVESHIYLDVLINGHHKNTYVLKAHKLESVSENLGPWCCAVGPDSHFKIDIPVVVS